MISMTTELINILLVEDNPGDARLIEEILRGSKTVEYKINKVETKSHALNFLSGNNIDAILLDLNLPDSSGIVTCSDITSTFPRVPVVVLTGIDDELIGEEALKIGAQDYLVKGQVDNRSLARALRYSIERIKIQNKLKESEARFRKMIEENYDGIIVTGLNGIIKYVNPAAEKLFNLKAEKLIGETFGFPVDVHKTSELVIPSSGNSSKIVEMHVTEVEWENSTVFLLVLHNITERKNTENLLRESEEEIRKLNEDLELRVARRTAELEAANKELESFTYSVSHDLRAPLRAIEGFSRILLEDYNYKLDEGGKKYLNNVAAAAGHMSELINDFLELSKITRNELIHADVDLSRIAANISKNLKEAEPGRDVKFKISPGITVNADSRLMEVLLENLLSNSWKYTKNQPGAVIEFGTCEQAGKRIYYIKDDGAGFDMKYVHKLFIPFQRLHSPKEYEGTGIGLATVQRIIARHGGKIWAEGEVGKGAVFRFTLP